MSIFCGVCGEAKDTSHNCTVFTGRVLDKKRTRQYGQTTYTTTYGEFEEHHYDVCHSCFLKWNFIFPIVVIILCIVLLKLLLFSGENWVAPLVLGWLPAVIVIYKYVSVNDRLIKDAIAQREMQRPGEYKGFDKKPTQ
jgi:hypothetical protein